MSPPFSRNLAASGTAAIAASHTGLNCSPLMPGCCARKASAACEFHHWSMFIVVPFAPARPGLTGRLRRPPTGLRPYVGALAPTLCGANSPRRCHGLVYGVVRLDAFRRVGLAPRP